MKKRSFKTPLSFIEAKMETDLSTDLCTAIKANDLNTITDLISKGADVNAFDKKNKLPLQVAIENEFVEIIEKLIKNGVNVNVKIHVDNKHLTLLEYAMEINNPTIVTLLVENGADTILYNNNEETVLHYAARTGALELVKNMIDKGTNIDVKTNDGLTPLHVAAKHQRFEVVKYLCKMGADINARNCRESTPLFFAINESNTSFEITKFLIDNGADIEVENVFNYTPLQYALDSHNFEVAKFLIEKGSDVNRIYSNTHYARHGLGGTLLHWAARNYNGDDIMKFLIENGANINAAERDGRTPLCLLIKHNGTSEMIKYFVEHGAYLNIESRGSPFFWACYVHDVRTQILLIELGLDVNTCVDYFDEKRAPLHMVDDLSVTELLIAKGANVNVIDALGNTPLHYARRFSMVKCLVQNGAEINIKNHEGRTPLHTTFDFLTVQYLVQKGADIHATDLKGYTPLHLANDVFIAEYLIEQGADVKAVTIDGKTVLHGIAELDSLYDVRYKDVPNVVNVFLEKGININATDENGNTPLHLCAEASNYYTFLQLLSKGANIFATNNEGKKPEDCDYGICTEMIKFIKKLVSDLKESVDPKKIDRLFLNEVNALNTILDNRKSNILHLFVQNCKISIIRSLFRKLQQIKSMPNYISKNDFINAQDIDHCTPLHYAAQKGNSDIVMCLLQNGSIYNAENVNCETPLTLTADDITKSILQLTEQMFKEINLGNYAEVVNCINKKKEIINAKDKDGNSPLHLAIYHGHTEIIKLLLNRGAEIIQINKKGNTTLHLASSKDSKEIAEKLLWRDNVKCKNKNNEELLHSFINVKAKDGMTALHIAAKYNRIETVKLLLNLGASYNIDNKEGKCPIDLSTDTDIITLFKYIQELFDDAENGRPEIINKLQDLNDNEFNIVTATCTKQRYTLEDILKYNEYKSILSEFSKIKNIKKTQVSEASKTVFTDDSDFEDMGFGLFD